MTALSYQGEIHLRAVAALGHAGGAPPFEVEKLQGLARQGLIRADVCEGRCTVRVTEAGLEALASARDEQVNMATALAARCHDTGGVAPTPEGLRTLAKLLAQDEDARILFNLWIAKEVAAREVSDAD